MLFKSKELSSQTQSRIQNATIINSIILIIAITIDLLTAGSWLNPEYNYWIAVIFLAYSLCLLGSYKNIIICNLLMMLSSVVFAIIMGFTIILIPLSIIMIYLNIKSFSVLMKQRN